MWGDKMALITKIKNMFSKTINKRALKLAQFLNSESTFSQFGDSIYDAEIVQSSIDAIATEFSKLKPQHIRVNTNGEQEIPKSGINRIFKYRPNPLMTTRDFLEKCIWQLYLNYNLFIYPIYKVYKDSQGVMRKNYTGFYPLDPHMVTFEEDLRGKLFIHFYFRNGEEFTTKYEDIIHIRKKYSVNDMMGGGENGQPDNEALLKILEADSTLTEGTGKAVESSLAIKGILKLNTILNNTDTETERDRFEELLSSSSAGVLPIDMKSEFEAIKIDPKLVDKDTVEMIENKAIRWYGVSSAIMSGNFSDEEYQAFYEKVLEPLVVAFGQAFTTRIFSQREVDFGNEIVFYHLNMNYLSTKAKLDIIKITGEQGLLTNDQKLALLGYPPIGGEEGAKRTQSLNYIDVNLATQYQIGGNKAEADKKKENSEGEGDDNAEE